MADRRTGAARPAPPWLRTSRAAPGSGSSARGSRRFAPARTMVRRRTPRCRSRRCTRKPAACCLKAWLEDRRPGGIDVVLHRVDPLIPARLQEVNQPVPRPQGTTTHIHHIRVRVEAPAQKRDELEPTIEGPAVGWTSDMATRRLELPCASLKVPVPGPGFGHEPTVRGFPERNKRAG